jgi:hypothetical protein
MNKFNPQEITTDSDQDGDGKNNLTEAVDGINGNNPNDTSLKLLGRETSPGSTPWD